MDFFEAVEKRYSCRNLQSVDITAEQLEMILDAGCRAASGMNIQPFKFLVMKDRKNIEIIAQSQQFITGASVVIGIVANPQAIALGVKIKDNAHQISNHVSNFQLSLFQGFQSSINGDRFKIW